MQNAQRFQQFLEHLQPALGHADRFNGLQDYCQALMLPIERKSIEPLAAQCDPVHVPAKHQSLHHFIANADWSDAEVLARTRQWVLPHLHLETGCFWIIDDTGFPKHGKHSVGVARQYCGQLGKQDNCQVAVSLSVASATGSLPIAYQLYLPKEWVEDTLRRQKAGVPEDIVFRTKPEIACDQLRDACAAGVPKGIVLSDAAYGDDTSFREAITGMGLTYAVGIRPGTTVWAGSHAPLSPKKWTGNGRPPSLLRRGPGHQPQSVAAMTQEWGAENYRNITWREGTNTKLSSRFACWRVRPAHQDFNRVTPRAEEWLVAEWPPDAPAPTKYWFSTLSAKMTLRDLVYTIKMRWRIERDYLELKQEFGLGHFEGRNWRGFHHHATVCIAAYGFLTAGRAELGTAKKNHTSEAVAVSDGNKPCCYRPCDETCT